MYTLIRVFTHNTDGTVNGIWTQDMVTATLPEALKRAAETSEINLGLEMAVVKDTTNKGIGAMIYHVTPLTINDSVK